MKYGTKYGARGADLLDEETPIAFNLRMRPDLRQALDVAAKENGRSLNAEIVHRLKASLEGWKR